MKKLRLLCISPYEGMYNLMTNIAAKRSDVELIVHMGDREDGLKAVLENRNNDIDMIISRGGTADLIRAHCGDIPACDITPSVYDVLHTIRLAQSISERFAVVGFPSITQPADMLRDIMQYDFEVHTIHGASECEVCMKALYDEGIRVIAGDMVSVNCAQSLGMHGLLIVSGIESVEAAIDNAVETRRYYEAIIKQASLFSALLRTEETDTIIYAPNGEKYFSTTKDLPPKVSALLQQRSAEVIAKGSLSLIRHIGDSVFSIKGRLLQTGSEDYCAWTLTRLANHTVFDKYITCYSSPADLPDSDPLEFYLGNSEAILATHATCDRYAAMNAPVLILGQRGTGKNRMVHYMYSHSKRKDSSFLEIDCSLLDDKGWNYLLKNDSSPLTDSGLTLHFKRVNTVAPSQQKQFILYLQNSSVLQAHRLFFTYTLEQGAEPEGELYLYLTETVRCLQMRLPTLRQRTEDIPALVGLYINSTNVRHGTRVIGMTHAATLILQNHSWPRNIDQLYHTVQNLVINAKSSYISEDQVNALLTQETQSPENLREANINLERTLNEIIRDVVMRVFKSENMNQTHTAKRLGISRSTLWRMLK